MLVTYFLASNFSRLIPLLTSCDELKNLSKRRTADMFESKCLKNQGGYEEAVTRFRYRRSSISKALSIEQRIFFVANTL